MGKKLLLLILFIGTAGVYAQKAPVLLESRGSYFCHQQKIRGHNLALPMKAVIPHSFDVLNYSLNLDIYNCFLPPYPNSFSALEVITLLADSALTSITLDANSTSLIIDGISGNAVSYNHAADLLKVTLDKQYLPGDTLQVKILYHHLAVSDNAVYTSAGFFFTDCEPEGARKWFPCWDKPSDKATTELMAKTPSNVKLGSNGRLADSVKTGDTIYYHWISRDPVATYLTVVTAKIAYGLDIVYWENPQTKEKIPFRFYYNSGEDPSAIEDIIGSMTSHYSELFCTHPFEKNGFATLNNQFIWGGMENQTLTSLCPDCWYEDLVSHEFAHQWFGDMITCATWADIFLNEGFATYCEALWIEYTSNKSGYKANIDWDAEGYLTSGHTWPIYNPSWITATPDINTLFDTPVTYDKGACVLHMLRYALGDTLFFNGLKAYVNDPELKFRSATINDLKRVMSATAGQDLSWFFDPWFNQPAHPTYQNQFFIGQRGESLWTAGLAASQTLSATPFHAMPVELSFTYADGSDTTLRVFNSVNNQQFSFLFQKQPVAVTFDPNNNIVLKKASLFQINPGPIPDTANSQTNSNVQYPVLAWTSLGSGVVYTVQVATDSLFQNIVFLDTNVAGTQERITSLNRDQNYYWRVRAKVSGQNTAYSDVSQFILNTSTGLPSGKKILNFACEQNYPNPFNPLTTIKFTLAVSARTTVRVYNGLGRMVSELINNDMAAGEHEVSWNAQSVPSGIYFCKLTSGNNIAIKKLVLLK